MSLRIRLVDRGGVLPPDGRPVRLEVDEGELVPPSLSVLPTTGERYFLKETRCVVREGSDPVLGRAVETAYRMAPAGRAAPSARPSGHMSENFVR